MREPLPHDGARELLEAIYERDPGAVKATVLLAFQTAGGSWIGAAEELEIEPVTLSGWVKRLGIETLIRERWPAKENKEGI